VASAFDFYLRTGRSLPSAAKLETKFNPWHDPDDGRFTFAGQGRRFGGTVGKSRHTARGRFGSRGGSFGGGGAGGSWDEEPPQPSKRGNQDGSGGGGGATGSWSSPVGNRRRKSGSQVSKPSAAGSTSAPERPPGGARLTIRKNGYVFLLDAHARTRRVSGEIRLQTELRSRGAQSGAGKPDRRITDDGGHYIAARFNGPRDIFNHFAQDANFNRGAYRVLEDRWAKAVRSGSRVFVDIIPHYRGTSMRPYKLVVTWNIGGTGQIQDFPNEKQSK
jgi:hypothetical protein